MLVAIYFDFPGASGICREPGGYTSHQGRGICSAVWLLRWCRGPVRTVRPYSFSLSLSA